MNRKYESLTIPTELLGINHQIRDKINMQNKPNLQIHNTQYDIRNTRLFMQNKANVKPNTHKHKKTINHPRPKADSTNNQLSLINIGAKRKSAYGGINGKANPITIPQIENWK